MKTIRILVALAVLESIAHAGGTVITQPVGQQRVTGTCVGQVIVAIAANGTVTCEADDGTAYTAGSGLTLLTGVFAIDPTYAQRRVSGTCAAGSSIATVAQDGTVTCEADDNTTYTASTGLTLGGNAFSVTTNGIADTLIRQSAGLSVVGRSANTTGNVADITAVTDGHVLRLLGTTLGFGTVPSGSITGLAAIATSGSAADLVAGTVPAARMPALTGDVTTVAGAVATTIAASAVTDAKLRNSAALSVIGRSANSVGAVADISAAADGDVLRRSAGVLGFGAVPEASVTGVITGVTVTSPACAAGSFMATLTGGATSGDAPIGGTCVAEPGDISNVSVSGPISGGGASGSVTIGLANADYGDVTVSGTGTTWTVDSGAVAVGELANIATARILGRVTAASGVVEELTGTQATTLLDTFSTTTTTKGLVPGSNGAGATAFLNGNGAWTVPAGAGDITDVIAGVALTGGGSSGSVTLDLAFSSDFQNSADTLDLSTAVTAPGSLTVATTLGVTGLSTLSGGMTTPANLTTTGTGDLVSGDALTVANGASIGNDTTDVLDFNGDLAKFGSSDGSMYTFGESISFAYATDADAIGYLSWRGYLNGVTRFRDLIIGDGKQVEACRVTGSTKSLNCVGGHQENGSPVLSGTITANTIPKGSSGNLIDTSITDDGAGFVRQVKVTYAGLTVGDDVAVATNTQSGIRLYAFNDGNNYFDSKTYAGGTSIYRVGAGAEIGGARTWLTVTNSTGAAAFTGNLTTAAGLTAGDDNADSHAAIGALALSDDVGAAINTFQKGLTIYDNTNFASGVGGGITLAGKYNTAGGYVTVGIKAAKSNATDGNYSMDMLFGTTPNGGSYTERLRIRDDGGMTFNSTAGTAGQVLTIEAGTLLPKWATAAGGGNVTAAGLTTGKIPKASGASALVDSLITETTTTLSATAKLELTGVVDSIGIGITHNTVGNAAASAVKLLKLDGSTFEYDSGSNGILWGGHFNLGAAAGAPGTCPGCTQTGIFRKVALYASAASADEVWAGIFDSGDVSINSLLRVGGGVATAAGLSTRTDNGTEGIYATSSAAALTADYTGIWSAPNVTENATAAARNTYAFYADNTSTRSTGANNVTNYGIYAKASGGQVNYSGYFDTGSFHVAGTSTFASNVTVSGQLQGYTHLTQAADQDVTNSAVLVDSTDMQFAVIAGKVYAIDGFIAAAGSSTTGDYKYALVLAGGGTMNCSGTQQSLTTADAIQNTTVIATAAAATTSTSVGTRADETFGIGVRFNVVCKVTNAGTLKYQFAQATATAAKLARTMAGSYIRYRQLN